MKITKIAPAQWAVVDAAGFELFTGQKDQCIALSRRLEADDAVGALNRSSARDPSGGTIERLREAGRNVNSEGGSMAEAVAAAMASIYEARKGRGE